MMLVGVLDTDYGAGIAQDNEVGGNHHHLFNCLGMGDILSQSFQKLYPPCDEHVVHEDEVLIC